LTDTDALDAMAITHSLEDIEHIGKRFRTTVDPIERRAAFLELLAGMTVENALEIRKQIEDLNADDPAFRDFHYAWGKIGGSDAVMHGADTKKPDMLATLAGWASANPNAARDWFSNLDPKSDNYHNQEYLKMGMVHGLANANPELAAAFIQGLAARGDEQAGHMMGIVSNKVLQTQGVNAAARWAENLRAGDVRMAAMGQVAHQFARSDPQAAAEWARSVGGDDARRAIGAVGHEWAKRDGPAAVAWLNTLEETPGRMGAFHSTFDSWAGSDPRAASEHLAEMPASPERDHSINGLVNRHRWEDPQAAIAWAEQIQSQGLRESSMVSAAQAFFRRDHQAAREWLSTSNVSEEVRSRIGGGRRR